MTISIYRQACGVAAIAASVALAACQNSLDVKFPGQIPTEQIQDPTLAPVLVRSVIGDFECAYSNYMSGSSVHSDEYETANSNVPLANWGERTITADENDYAIGTCEGNFGSNLTLHTARFQSEDVAKKLEGWTDAQVVLAIVLLNLVGGESVSDLEVVEQDEGFCAILRRRPITWMASSPSRWA